MNLFRKKPKKRQTSKKEGLNTPNLEKPSESLKNPSQISSKSLEGVESGKGAESPQNGNVSFSGASTGTYTYYTSNQNSNIQYKPEKLEYGLKEISENVQTEEKSTVALSNKFDEQSKKQLESCNPKLQEVFNSVIEKYDLVVVQGVRTKKEQNELHRIGKTGVYWPGSGHNLDPSRNPTYSLAVDVVPKIQGEVIRNPDQLLHFAGYVKAVADSKGIRLKCKAISDNHKIKSMNVEKLTHFELEA